MSTDINSGDHFIHYKGGIYVVDFVAKHSETEEPLVIYREKLGDRTRWARPLSMWLEPVLKNGEMVPRFRKF